MNKLIVPIILIFAVYLTSAQKVPAPDQFSNPTIQIGVVVEDLEKSLDFYTNIIGMTKTGEFNVGLDKAKDLGLSDKYELDVKVLKLQDSPQANEWKLMSFGTKPGHKKPNWVHDDTGVQYITIFVNHLNPFIERIKKNNIKILSGAPSELGGGNFFILIQDPDGTFIELIGPK